MARALITGAGGFAGSYLVEECLACGWEVHGTHSTSEHSPTALAPGCTWHALDLRDAQAPTALVAMVQPDYVFHLAAQASVAAAWADPVTTLTDNIVMSHRVLEATRLGAPVARLLLVSSSEVYGAVTPERMPVAEDEPLRPLDPYGVSKVGVEMLGLQFARAFGLQVVLARPFNHIGPRQRRGFAVADFAAQIAAIEQGHADPVLRVGNLSPIRDFTDVRDMVRAYRLLIERGRPGEVYNISSGTPRRIGELVELLIAAATVPVDVVVDPARLRSVDRPMLVGSSAAVRNATGWTPLIPLATTLLDTLNYWRNAEGSA